jgi:aspartate aminotransferase
MAAHLSERTSRIKPSASIVAKRRVSELQAQGRRIIDLTIGEPDLDTPEHIRHAAVVAMERGDTHYTPTAGTAALRAAICTKFARENGLSYEPRNVIVGCGAKQIIFEAFAATLDPGDEVIIPAPYWVSYPDMVLMNDGRPVIVDCPEIDGFKLTPEGLERAITPKTRWLVFNSPSNPTGAVYRREELAALADVLDRHPHVWILTDEIYEHLVYDGQKHVSLITVRPGLAERALVVNGVSKAYAMTGWRVGYGAGPVALVDCIAKIIGQSTTCAGSIAQAAAVAALRGDQACVAAAAEDYHRRRDRMCALLDGVPGLRLNKPAGAFYLYPSVAGLIGSRDGAGRVLESDFDVAMHLLEAGDVAVLDGTPYGLSPYLRLSFAASMAAIEEGCVAIRKACEDLVRQPATI